MFTHLAYAFVNWAKCRKATTNAIIIA